MEGTRRRIPRHRPPLVRRLLADPGALRRWLLVLALAATASLTTSSIISAADEARDRWDTTRPVVVTTSPLQRGDTLSGSLAVAEWPAALAPDGAVSSLADVGDDARAAGPMAAGAPVTGAGTVRSGTTEADDLRRVAIAHGPAPLPVRAGDRVDVWATYDPSLAGSGLQTRRVASGAEVVTVDDRVTVVAVETDDAASVTEAVALATVVLVGVG